MISMRTEHGRLICSGIAVASVTLMAFSLALAGQTQPALQITSPADGTVVTPGQTITVSVASPNNTAFKQVFVIGEQPLPASTIATSVPAQFSILIPQATRPGKYLITAWGGTTANQVQGSSPVTIDVERADLPTSLNANRVRVSFQSQGQKVPLRISGTFADGSVADLTVSSNMAYTSSNASIATVDNNGVVTAIATGNASITATYGQGAQGVRVSVPVTVPPPVLTSSPTTLSFNSENVGTSSSPQTVTITNVSNNQGLKVGPVSAMGDFSETDNCASSSPIAVGGLCTINVTFRPAVAGNRTGTVSVPDSMDIVPLAIPLSGTGVTPPSITAINPTSGLAGTSVTISGMNFGTAQGTSTVTFNGVLASATSWSDTTTSIVATVPSGATTGNVVVAVGGVASNGVSFTVPPSTTPNITSINPAFVEVGKTSVTISGMNFGATQGKSTVTFNGTATKPTSWSATSIVATAPTGATSGNVVVTVGGIASNGVGFTAITCDPRLNICYTN